MTARSFYHVYDEEDVSPSIRPCPRCGKEAHWQDDYAIGISIICDDCGYYNIGEDFDSLGEFADWWNKRPLEDALRARIAELEVSLATPRWKPVRILSSIRCNCWCDNRLRYNADGNGATITLDSGDDCISFDLPPNLRLHQRVEVSE